MHEVVVVREQIRAFFLDENATAVKLQTLLVVAAVKIKGGLRRQEQQRIIGKGTLGMQREAAQGLRVVMEGLLVKLVVVLLLDL